MTKRSSETPVTAASAPLLCAPAASKPALKGKSRLTKSRLTVTIKKYHGVAKWTWGEGSDDCCGICQMPYEGCAPGINFPGDDCPVVWGRCKHAYHLQCVSTWLGSGKTTCPICRAEWEFAEREQKEAQPAPV
ncbi:hypothetical protein TeGR_g2535 [Tetraparma gracilis]|uniref:Anaphase-promoting complex subunit 11 n=1 Tax=Tetraparma gracilis TaxID=2962635 RepID=A0ABQ6MNX7_9STRA|nr:hypothetical protein TeGR_g2535 [Tetraparma gracilis]